VSEQLLAVGVDGARGGWLAALGYGQGADLQHVEFRLIPTFASVAGRRADDAVMAVDIPMGLLDSVALRQCDAAARALLGRRASTVFAPPSRALLAAATYTDARELVEQERQTSPQAKGLSAQAFGIAPKMREADEYLLAHPGAQAWLWECHPELSFRALAEGRVLADKKSVSGQAARLVLLSDRFPDVLEALAALQTDRREAELTDALDALVSLDTALRIRAGDFEQLGGETDARGLVMRMVF
jgi:predicted RNase H-like nuclease